MSRLCHPRRSLRWAVLVLVLAGCSTTQPSGPAAGADTSATTPPSVTISPSAGQPVSPAERVVVRAAAARVTEVHVADVRTRHEVPGTITDGGQWTTTAKLAFAATYTVTATATAGDGRTVRTSAEIRTIDPAETTNSNMIPAPRAVRNAGVGVGQPIAFQFTRPVTDKAAVQARLKVLSKPAQEGAWYWIDDKNVHYRPRRFWEPNSTIHVTADLLGVAFGGGVYGAQDRDETYRVHDSWVAEADAGTQTMVVRHDGAVVKTMAVSLGKDSTPTHNGTHVVSDRRADYVMDSCTYGVCQGDPGYYRSHEKWAVRISNDGEFVHENPATVAQQGSSNVSHGCVNANSADAQWFYDHFGLGDVVEVTGSAGPALPLWDLWGDWSLPWPQWQAGNAR